MRRRTLEIKCSECGRVTFRYVKYGDGNLIRCYKKRIMEDYSVKENGKVKCPCGNIIGIERPTRILMIRHSFVAE
ncbi:MAG: hypothetical protein U9N35_08230 [Euryarchaeota archaeon]|nr:hypothetical protein [Euryarchaeota archaeon]